MFTMLKKNSSETIFIIQVCDLGISELLNRTSTSNVGSNTRQGTYSHVPPEVLENCGTESDFPEDVYAFAITLWEIFSGKIPYGKKI